MSVMSDFHDDIVCQETDNLTATNSDDLCEECPSQSTETDDATGELRNQLKQNVASLFKKGSISCQIQLHNKSLTTY